MAEVNYDAYLEKILNFIKVSDKEIEDAKRWIKIIKEGIEGKEGDKLIVKNTGSYNRNTAIRPLHDIDLFIILIGNYPKEISKLISRFESITRSVLDLNKEKLIGKNIRIPAIPAEHGIIIKYPRKDPIFMMDLVLAFPDQNKEDQFLIPDGDSWIKTSKAEHLAKLKAANIEYDGMATKYIKLFKYWNSINRKDKGREGLKPLRSYFLEELILANLPPVSESLSKDVCFLFEKLSKDVTNKKYQNLQPGGEPISEREMKRRNRSKVLLERDSKKCSDDKWQEIFNLPY